MPNLFSICGFKVYFWSNENNEPIHVHVSKGKPMEKSTKIWLTKSGGCILANNNSRISKADLSELLEIISAQYFFICGEWKTHFAVSEIKFYC